MINTILVVDDDAAVRGLLCRVLARGGYRVIEAGDMGTALGMLGAFTPDMAVVDAGLPDGHGASVGRRLKEAGKGFPVLMISGEPFQEASAPDVVDSFMAKPLELGEFASRVRHLLQA